MENEVKKDNNWPLVSVLIPCYNHEKYIIECLQSIYECDYKNIEVIMLDDGSKDKSYELATGWKNQYASRFINFILLKQENRGICPTLNTLINLSTGEYIIPLASDDKLLPNAISGPLEYAIKTQKKVIITDAELIDEEGILINDSAISYCKKNKKVLQNKFFFYLDILLLWEVPYQHYLIKKDFLVQIGMYNEKLVFEDLDLILKSLVLNEVCLYLPTTWQYRIRRNDRLTPGLSKKEMEKTAMEVFKIHYHKFNGAQSLLVTLFLLKGNKTKVLSLFATIPLKTFRIMLKFLHKVF